MKRIVLCLICLMLAALAAGFCVANAQETTEQYLFNLKNPGVKGYIELMYEGSHEGKLLAAIKLGELGRSETQITEALVYGLSQGTTFVIRETGKVTNDYWDVRAASAKALGQTRDPSSLKDLYYTLRYDPDKFVRASAAYAIGKIGKEESVSHLKRIIETSITGGPDDELILACIEGMGDIGHQSAFPPLVDVVRGKYNRSLKLAAMEAINRLKWE
jgi:hypothetical protein